MKSPKGVDPVSNAIPDFRSAKWSWACRHLIEEGAVHAYCLQHETSGPRPGDVALVRVERVGYHCHIETAYERRLRLYNGDRLACVFGNRYATDVYEGRAVGLDELHLLTESGVVGTVISRHRSVGRPTALSFLGYLADSSARRVNLIELRFRPSSSPCLATDVAVVVGTGKSTGKTTVVRKILRALVSRGVPVAGCKLTGTASPRDLREMHSTGALLTTDFSDYGFPSTYGLSVDELMQLFDCMLDTCSRKEPRLLVMEVADGFLQRETQMLLGSTEFRRRVRGIILAGPCSGSLVCAADYIQRAGFEIWAVSGLLTNSPLYMQEFANCSPIPVVPSRSDGDWADVIMPRIAPQKPEEGRWETMVEADH